MELTVKPQQSEQELVELIMAQYRDYVNNILQGALMPVRRRITDAVKQALLQSPEIQSILSGDLKQALGLVNPQHIVDDLVTAIINGMNIKQENMQSIGSRIYSGGYTIEISRADFQDVLSIPDASFTTLNNIVVPWLNWLLFAGDSPVVIGYVLQLDPNNTQNSRTGAIMVRKPGSSWSIPSEYAGTINNNFIIRALLPLEDEIDSILREEMQRRL